MGCSEQCNSWVIGDPLLQRSSFVGGAVDQKGLFSLEAMSQVREVLEAPCAQGSCREVREGL